MRDSGSAHKLVGFLLVLGAAITLITAVNVVFSIEILRSEKGTADVRGEVEDREGRGMEGVHVHIEGTGLNTTTDGAGSYLIDGVPAGIRTLKFSKPGYQSVRITDFVMRERYALSMYGEEENVVDLTPEASIYLPGPFGIRNNLSLEGKTEITLFLPVDGNCVIRDRMGGEIYNDTASDRLELELVPDYYTLTVNQTRSYNFTVGARDMGIDPGLGGNGTLSLNLSDAEGELRLYRYPGGEYIEWFEVIENDLMIPDITTAVERGEFNISLDSGLYTAAWYSPERKVRFVHNLTLAAGEVVSLNLSLPQTITKVHIDYSQPEDFYLCSSMLMIVGIFQLVGAVEALRRKGAVTLVTIAALASAINIFSPFFLNQIIALAALFLIYRAKSSKKESGRATVDTKNGQQKRNMEETADDPGGAEKKGRTEGEDKEELGEGEGNKEAGEREYGREAGGGDGI